MKKTVTLLLLLLAWYFAGMNRQPYVMSAVLCGIIFVLLSFILARILCGSLSADIPDQNAVIYKNEQAQLRVRTINKSRLPVNKYRMTLNIGYRGGKNPLVKRLNGSACPGGNADDNAAAVYYAAPLSGMIDVTLTRLRVYDYFMIFSSSKKVRNCGSHVAVLPVPRKIQLLLPPFGVYTNEPVAESSSDRTGDDYSEIRLVREYRDGDLTRHIHRNYSARTEKLWIKEYQRENDFIFDLYIDSSSQKPLSDEDRDAFFELVSAVLCSLLQDGMLLRVHYYDREKNGMVLYEMSEKYKIQELLAALIRADSFCTKEEFDTVCDISSPGNVMILSAGLEWFFCGEPVYKFSRDGILRELDENIFDLTNTGGGR